MLARANMRRWIASFLVLLALLLGSTAAPVLAHAGDGDFAHSTEVIDVHEDDAQVTNSGIKKQSDTKENGSAPAAAVHHHCTCATKIDDSAPEIATAFSSQIFAKTLVAVMPSRRSAPLTEPPSA